MDPCGTGRDLTARGEVMGARTGAPTYRFQRASSQVLAATLRKRQPGGIWPRGVFVRRRGPVKLDHRCAAEVFEDQR